MSIAILSLLLYIISTTVVMQGPEKTVLLFLWVADIHRLICQNIFYETAISFLH